MKNILSVLILSSSLFAVDVSDFDIKGIKLDMSKKEVLKKIPCDNPKIEQDFIDTIEGKKLYRTSIECKDKTQKLNIILSRKNKVFLITRKKDFNIYPSWDKIEKQILNYYGNPTCKTPNIYDVIPLRNICWGGCNIRKDNGTINVYDKSLEIYGNQSTEKNSFSYLSFTLWDINIENNSKKWYDEETKKFEDYQKEKATNIDF